MKLLLLADIHIGAIKDPSYVYNVLQEIIDREIGMESCDAVIILGDYFDHLFKANEANTALAINVMSYLVRKCKQQGTKIRIVYGTEGHEMGQYKLFNYHLTSFGTDMKVIQTVTEEELLPGVPVLYLPEEYVSSKGEFYHDSLYSGKTYRYIFGHGTIVEGVPEALTYGSTQPKVKHVPQFSVRDFAETHASVFFGHYHQHVVINPECCYVGSLFRYKFGEEVPKGYVVLRDDGWEFVENARAYDYRTISFDETSDVYESAEKLVAALNKVQLENEDILSGTTLGKLRLVFHVPKEAFPEYKETIRTLMTNQRSMTYLIKDTGFLEETEQETEEDEKTKEVLSYLLEPKLDISTKINWFLKEYVQPEQVLDKETIQRYITEPLEL